MQLAVSKPLGILGNQRFEEVLRAILDVQESSPGVAMGCSPRMQSWNRRKRSLRFTEINNQIKTLKNKGSGVGHSVARCCQTRPEI